MRLTIAYILGVFCLGASNPPELRKFVIVGQAQGTTYQVIYYAPDSIIRKHQIDQLLGQVDSSLSLYKRYSLINRFNESKSGAVVDSHFLRVLKKSIATFKETDGIFDITVQPLVQAWGFGATKSATVPDSAVIKTLKSCIGSQNLEIMGTQVVKKKPCIKVDMNGIAQGYTVDLMAALVENAGIVHYMVELGGEIKVKGRKQPGNEMMRIGIEAPGDDNIERGIMQRIISIDNGAITTSGNYRRYFESDGKKITHIIDPRSGYPIQNELISITVFAADAMTADAYDNALMVMGLTRAMEFVETTNGLAAHFIYRDKEGKIKDTMSRWFHKLVQ